MTKETQAKPFAFCSMCDRDIFEDDVYSDCEECGVIMCYECNGADKCEECKGDDND